MKSPKNDPKFRKPRPAEGDEFGAEIAEPDICPSPLNYNSPRTSHIHDRAGSTRGRRSADARTLKRYGRTRQEIDAFITEHYATKGPKWIAEQLGVRISTVIMRARKVGLPPLR